MSSIGATACLYQLEDPWSITVQEVVKAGYFREAHKSTKSNSLEGRRIRRPDSVLTVPCAKHVHEFRVRVRYVAVSYLRRLL